MPTNKGERQEDTGKAAKRAARKGKGREEVTSKNPSKPSRPVPLIAPTENVTPWNWSYLADPQVSKQSPVFTKDAKYFFVAVSSSVKIYSTITGKVISTLTSHSRASNGHSDRITCLKINPQNSFQLFTGSADGTVRTWDFLDAVLLRTIDVGYPISHLCAHQDIEGYMFVACQKPNKKKSKDEGTHTSVIMRVSLKTTNSTNGAKLQKSTELVNVGKVQIAVGIDISASGKWLIVVGGTKVYVAAIASLKSGFTKFVCPERLTCFSPHPAEDWFATGDETGQIRLWYCLKDEISFERAGEDKTAPTTTLHWHAHAIQAIEFTPNGAYLLSGGEESVLVIWQLHTGKKEFVPRVGAPIHTISVCDTGDGAREQEYLLGLGDGSLAFIRSSTLKLSRTIARMRLEPSHLHSRSSPPLVMQSNSRNLILPSSHPSSIQIYSPSMASLVAELEISPSNRISRPFQKRLNPSRVDQIAVSDCGKWLATVDMREGSDEGMSLDVFLKIWQWDESDKTWDLNTKVDRPHGTNKVHSLSFSPTSRGEEPLLASTGGDTNVKTWSLRKQVEKNSESTVYWVLRTAFCYRNQQASQAVWSADGSILAVCQGCFVTLWSVATNALHRLFTSSQIQNFTRLAFVGRSGRYLCAIGQNGAALFDLIRGQTVYVARTRHAILGLLSWPGKEEFALVHEATTAADFSSSTLTLFAVYTPLSSEPSRIHSVPFRIRQSIAWQGPASPTSPLPGIVAITHEGGLVHIGDNPVKLKEEGDAAMAIDLSVQGSSQPALFQDIFGKSAVLDFASGAEEPRFFVAKHSPSNQKPDSDLLGGPSHLLPTMQHLFSPLMQSMLRTGPSDGSRDKAYRVLKEDDMVVDSQDPVEVPADPIEGRPITHQEVNMFVGLFQDPAFTTARPLVTEPTTSTLVAQSAPHLTNGKAKANGVMTNGVHAAHGSPEVRLPLINGAISSKNNKSPTYGRPHSPPARVPSPTIGKKRKKAMMA